MKPSAFGPGPVRQCAAIAVAALCIGSLPAAAKDVVINAVVNARIELGWGFTTVRDVGSGEFEGPALRRAIAANEVIGPRLWTAMEPTRNAAELIGTPQDIGSVQAGRYADIIAVKGDPLADITELQRVEFVMKGGEVYKSDGKMVR